MQRAEDGKGIEHGVPAVFSLWTQCYFSAVDLRQHTGCAARQGRAPEPLGSRDFTGLCPTLPGSLQPFGR